MSSYDHPYSGEHSNFIRKHWNGDYSLGKSYWGNTVLVSVVTALLAFFALSLFNERSEARYSSIAVLSVTALSVAVWIWSVRGTWASASKHVSRGGKAFWAGAARVAIVLGALRLVGDLYTQAPNLAEHFWVALGDQPGPETKVQLRADGRSLLVSGGINDDTAQKLQQALNRAPRVRTIVLSSNGGWVGQGLAVADVISSRKLGTYVEDECSSACTIAFLAGQDRAANPKARIGFHSFRSVGADDDASASPTVQKVYRAAGLSEDFINRVLQTPSEKVWYPTTAELLQNGVLTRRSFGGETAAMTAMP
jgi:hypothetical protein